MERTSMSRKEFERGAVLERVVRGEVRLKEAVPLLGVSYRQAKRLYKRYRTEGRAGLVHRNVGRRSNHCRSAAERERVLAIIQQEYGGTVQRGPGQRFGPTLAAEHLWEDHGIRVPVSTLRDWMKDVGLWSQVRRSNPKPKRRERRAHFGELVQFDGSFHDWLRFGEQETIWAAVDVLSAWIERYGVPRALYTDWKNVYKRQPTASEEAAGEPGHTHFGRMCAKLGIEIIAAGSPQAKGRVERSNGTQQDRLIKKMRLLGIADDAAANAYVEASYLPKHNARYTVAAASPVDYHLPRNPDLRDEDVFCLEHVRTVGKDFVVQFRNQALQLERAARGRVPAGAKVIVRESREGTLRVIHVSRIHGEYECRWSPAQPRAPKAEGAVPPPKPERKPNKPAPDHPWRQYPGRTRAAVVVGSERAASFPHAAAGSCT